MATEPTSRTSYREGVGLVLLALAPFWLLAIFALTRTGRDHTAPFLVGSAMLAGLGGFLVLQGLCRAWDDRATAGAACLLLVLLNFLVTLGGLYGIGSTDLQLTIRVQDADTLEPIPHAAVRLVPLYERESGKEPAGQTDAQGAVHLQHRFLTATGSSALSETGSVYLSGEAIRVDAVGYEPFRKPLTTFTGPSRSVYDDSPLPVVEVSLRKLGRK